MEASWVARKRGKEGRGKEEGKEEEEREDREEEEEARSWLKMSFS